MISFTVFLDAPHILQPVDLVGLSSNSNPQATLEALDSAAEPDPTLAPRAWWKVNEDRTVAYGLEETLELLRDVLKEQKFNVGRHSPPSLCGVDP